MPGGLVTLLLALAIQDPPPLPEPEPTEQPAPQQPADTPPQASEEPPVAVRPPPLLDFTRPFDHVAYEAALGAIAEAFPDLMRVRSLGTSRGGREIWLAVLADTVAEEPRRHPAAVFVTDLAPGPAGDVAGPEAAIFVLESLLVRARNDADLRESFKTSALYFLPAPDPDHAFPASPDMASSGDGDPGIECRLEENFPARWQPFGDGVRAPGPYALSEPESATIARLLLERENLSTLVLLSREAPPREPPPGSLRAYARETLDLALLEARPWDGERMQTDIGGAPAGFEATAALAVSVLEGLPRLSCSAPRLERLRPDLWLLDLPLRNQGEIPTLGDASRRQGFPSVSMRISGGRMVACALRETRSESFRALATSLEVVPIGHLDGWEVKEVRIVVQAEEGAELSFSFSSLRAGNTAVGATLR
ncbi:MAG: M14 family zinc carboxypeptidase [Planctomycetota bacterium]